MSVTFSILATIFFAMGMFLTKDVTLKISIYKGIGPLFILNAFFVAFLIPLGSEWKLWTGSIPYLHIAGAIGSAIAAGVTFMMISRGTASVATVGSTIAPAVVLLAGPFFLGTSVVPAQILTLIFLFFVTLAPLRNSLNGLSSIITIFFMILASLMNGFITIVTVLLFKEGVGVTEAIIVRQVLAGLIFMIFFPPVGFHLSDFRQLVRRAIFVSLGWIFSIYALQQGRPVVVQSIMATTPVWVVLIEIIAYRRGPSQSLIVYSLAVIIGIYLLVQIS